MTREEYEERRRRLDAELRAGVDLLEQGHRAQVRALDLVWSTQDDHPGGVPPSWPATVPPAPPAEQPRRSPGELFDAVDEILDDLPLVFTKNDVCRALGKQVDRRALRRVLHDLLLGGHIAVEAEGGGRIPISYRRLPGAEDF